MKLWMREGLSYCVASNRAIFLDLNRNRYFCLAPQANEAFLALISGKMTPSEEMRLHAILPADVFTSTPHGERIPAEAATMVIVESMIENALPTASRKSVIQALFQLKIASTRLKLFSLAQLVASIERRKRSVSRPADARDPGRVAEIVAAYERSSRYAARHDRCLPRSIAMTSQLLASGIVPTLVFAVMVRPFQAHCWVQYEDRVLNDRLDNVRNFTPILTV